MSLKNSASVQRKYEELERRARSVSVDSSKPLIQVGLATCGRAAGALDIYLAFEDALAKHGIDAEIMEVGCMGHCYAEPMAIVSREGFPPILYHHLTPVIAENIVKNFLINNDPGYEFLLGALDDSELIPSVYLTPRFSGERKVILKHCGLIDSGKVEAYIKVGGYRSLVSALCLDPAELIALIGRSGLRGRGGAGFPTAEKWDVCRKAEGDVKYVICNADEGDPGAFMDRAILESCPHQVIEGLIASAYAIGADRGYIYLRSEYPLAIKRVQEAIDQAESWGLLGDDILGSGFDFQLKIFRGSGAFVCGEETALISSMEGRRGMPQHRPPFPATHGLHGKPTLVNNVKTLSYVPSIIANGPEWFAAMGSDDTNGTVVFSLAGKVNNVGLLEVPAGTTLRELLFDICGGIQRKRRFKAVQIGGPSGGCLPSSLLDTPIDFGSLRNKGAMMGSGGMVVLDEDDCMVEVARYFLDFTQKESCGKCTFCRIGTLQMLEILKDFTRGAGSLEDIEILQDLAADIKDGSLCNLGRTAPNPVLTTLRYFRDEYEAHVLEQRCPALVCRELIAYWILPDRCARGCDACVGTCPTEAVYTTKKTKVINQEKCIQCGECVNACPPEYKAVVKVSPRSLLPEPDEPDPRDTGAKEEREETS